MSAARQDPSGQQSAWRTMSDFITRNQPRPLSSSRWTTSEPASAASRALCAAGGGQGRRAWAAAFTGPRSSGVWPTL